MLGIFLAALFLVAHVYETVWVYRDTLKYKGPGAAVESALLVFLLPVVGLIFLMSAAESAQRKSASDMPSDGTPETL